MALVFKNPPANAGDTRDGWFDPWIRRIPWRRAQQHMLVFLPRKSNGQRSLVSYGTVLQSQTQQKELSMHMH